MLKNIAIILVETSHAGNIGSTARAMKTMGLENLILVNPHDFPSGEAVALASGADDILENAQVVPSLEVALADAQLILGTSARLRTLPCPLLTPRQSAEIIIPQATQQKIAIIFGRERTGLTNEELAYCHYHIHIPTVEYFSSLNLAAAVQIMCYELRIAELEKTAAPTPAEVQPEHEIASFSEINGFYEHLEKTLYEINFLDPNHPKLILQRLKRLFNRARPDTREVNILRGILSAVEKKHN